MIIHIIGIMWNWLKDYKDRMSIFLNNSWAADQIQKYDWCLMSVQMRMLHFFARHCNLTSYFTLIKLEVEASMCNLVNWKCMRFKSLWIASHMLMWIWYFVYCWMKKISWNGLFCFVFGSYQWQTFHTSTSTYVYVLFLGLKQIFHLI